MKELIVWSAMLVSIMNLNGMEREITAITQRDQKGKQSLKDKLQVLSDPQVLAVAQALFKKNVHYPINAGDKQFYPADLCELTEEERSILFKTNDPSCWARCQGANSFTLRSQDIKEINRHEGLAKVMNSTRVTERQARPCINDSSICCTALTVGIVGIGITAVSFFITSLVASSCCNPLVGGVAGGVAGGTVGVEAGLGSLWLTQPLCCYEERDYVFGETRGSYNRGRDGHQEISLESDDELIR
jgi:hypothetical protein